MKLEEALVSVWRQIMVEGAEAVELGGQTFQVRATPHKNLRQVDFSFESRMLRGLEQNPSTRSRWAEMARGGTKVMQFLESGRYLGVVADGKVTMYGKAAKHSDG